jgi:hypothetical protein
VHGHAFNLWVDYYLERKTIIDALIDGKMLDKPRFSLTQNSASAPPAPTYSLRKPDVKRDSTSSNSTPRASARRTANSLSTRYFAPVAPGFETIPIPPSREPTPPSEIVPTARGNLYTDADKEYFVKYVSWITSRAPDTPKQEILKQVAQKANIAALS